MKPILSFIPLLILFFLAGCQTNGNDSSYTSLSGDSTSVTGLTGDSVKLVKTAAINFKVKDVEQGARAVSTLAKQYGGMIRYQHFQSVENEKNEHRLSTDSLLVITSITPQAEITASVPSAHLETFLYAVADLGYYTSNSQLHIDDKSLHYLENALKQKNRNKVLAQPASKNNKPGSTLQTIAVKDESIEQYIANRAIQAKVDYSSVSLSLFQNPVVRKEVVANSNISDYQLPFGERLRLAVSDGWHYFLGFLIAIAHLWMFLFFGIIAVIAYRFWQQKRKLKLS